jgi:hypothetical protein
MESRAATAPPSHQTVETSAPLPAVAQATALSVVTRGAAAHIQAAAPPTTTSRLPRLRYLVRPARSCRLGEGLPRRRPLP